MPFALQYLTCEDMPTLELEAQIATRVQLSLPWGDESAQTSLTYLGVAEDQRFERYAVLHQVERNVDAFYNQEVVRQLLENRRFSAYFQREAKYFFVRTRRVDARGVFDRLARAKPPVHGTTHEIDLTKLLSLGKTTGAYFGNLRIDKVRSAAVFGSTTVVESEEWEHYAELGDLTGVYMQVISGDGQARTVQLLRDRSLVIMKSAGERSDLEFAADVQSSIDTLLGS